MAWMGPRSLTSGACFSAFLLAGFHRLLASVCLGPLGVFSGGLERPPLMGAVPDNCSVNRVCSSAVAATARASCKEMRAHVAVWAASSLTLAASWRHQAARAL